MDRGGSAIVRYGSTVYYYMHNLEKQGRWSGKNHPDPHFKCHFHVLMDSLRNQPGGYTSAVHFFVLVS